MEIREIRFAEMFGGIGGFRFGLERVNLGLEKANKESGQQIQSSSNGREEVGNSGIKFLRDKWDNGYSGQPPKKYTCVWSNDNDRYTCQIYRKNFGNEELVEADIRTINPDSIPDFELLTAGFPCQSFSVAGKRKGFQDTRGTLFYEICRIAKAKRPSLLLLENVKGLLSHDEGLTFQIILESLEELGYWVEWQVLNSKHHGVPQNQERVFIIAHLAGSGGREVFPVGEAHRDAFETQGKARRERPRLRVANPLGVGGSFKERNLIANTLSRRYHKDGSENLIQVNPSLNDDGTVTAIDASYYKGHGTRGNKMRALAVVKEPKIIHNIYGGFGEGLRVFEDYSPTIRTPKGGGHLPMVAIYHHPRNIDRKHIYQGEETLSALRTVQRPPSKILEKSKIKSIISPNSRIRRLTPTECERLQAFPDGWTEFGLAETQGEADRANRRHVSIAVKSKFPKGSLIYGIILRKFWERGMATLKPKVFHVSDTSRYKTLGNAVTVSVITFLGGLIRDRCFQ